MLNGVIWLALKYRMLVVALSLALLVYGSIVATQLPIDVLPDLDRPRVVILTECPGLATEEAETLVTQPLEVALLGAAGVQAVRSQTTAGLSVVYVEFDWSIAVNDARQTVQQRLATLTTVLPTGIVPQMTPTSSIMGQILIAGMSRRAGPQGGRLAAVAGTSWMAELVVDEPGHSEVAVWDVVDRKRPESWQRLTIERGELSELPSGVVHVRFTVEGHSHEATFRSATEQAMELRSVADWVIRPRLRKIPGVAEVFVQGGERKQYQVHVDPTKLIDYGVTLEQVEQALDASNVNTSGGFAASGEQERPIRILGRLGPESTRVVADLEEIPVRASAERPVLLKHVARVVEAPQMKRGDGSVNGRPGVVLTIAKQPHVDTRALTEAITASLAEAEASLPPDVVIDSDLFRMKTFIDRGIYNVAEALVIGAVLVLVVLFLFLLNLRTTFITLTAIPLSLVITTLVFRAVSAITDTPLSMNVMTLGGIAVAMGELVDDAIVDVENIFRRLAENRRWSSPLPALQVVYEASREVRSAIVFGTIVVILVFLPLFALGGVEGRLFTPLAIAYVVSLLASLAVSLTVTPVLSYYLLGNTSLLERGEGALVRWLKRGAAYLIRLSMALPTPLLLLTWVLVAVSAWQVSRLGRNFLPPFDEGSVQVNVTLPPGSSLEASNRVAAAVDRRLRTLTRTSEQADSPLRHFVRRTGRAEMDEHAMPVSASEYIVSLNPASPLRREQVLEQLLHDLRSEVPGVDVEVEQPLAHAISHMISGVYAQIAIKIHGDDLHRLVTAAEDVRRAIDQVPGITPPVVEPLQHSEELHIRLRAHDLARYGLTRAYVGRILQTALQGEVTSQVIEGERRFDLLVRLVDNYRDDDTRLARLRIDLPDHQGQVELAQLADITRGLGAATVGRENARRRIVVRCNTQNRDLASAVEEMKRRVEREVTLPPGYSVEFGGQFESQQRATRLLLLLAALSALGMVVVLLLLFPSVRIVLQILNALPTAFIGGVFALVLTGQSLSVASLVGFISLGGIAVRNGILLVTHYVHLMQAEGETFSRDMILRGSLERLSPVLMTALTAGIGLLPLVIGGQQPGREILYPVATVILGGLITSTFCEFLIHPGLFWAFTGRDAERLAQPHDGQSSE
jgi:HME family heavy-metal exporter